MRCLESVMALRSTIQAQVSILDHITMELTEVRIEKRNYPNLWDLVGSDIYGYTFGKEIQQVSAHMYPMSSISASFDENGSML